ncbi:MAG: hypothetical protein CL840_02085 [Crocinitomicaceae bacterium]|nr:hypothetical protein [Crocinitomicaceae bacterium]|tara:strand:+ start:11301 stop:11882 length:582 start_codon:yes stop_codon:yes gene_type:complete
MKIAILEDHLIVAQSVAELLKARYNGEVSILNPESLDYNTLNDYEVLLLDFDYGPLGDANDILDQLNKLNITHLKIILFSSFSKQPILMTCRNPLVQGYVHKSFGFNDLVQAVDTVVTGRNWYQPKYEAEIKQLLALPKSDVLSAREKEVVRMAKQGKPREEIAKELNISVKTVDSHLGNIYQKLDINSIREL